MALIPSLGGVALALLVLIVVIRMVVTKTIDLRYATLWLVTAIGLAVIALWPGLLAAVANFLGFQVASNLLLIAGLVLLMLVALQISSELTSAEKQIQRLAEEVALLKTQQATPVATDHQADETDTALRSESDESPPAEEPGIG